jgi:hypothetical protein
MYMVMFVLDNTNQLDEVLDAWNALGVSGVTIMETMGSYRRRQRHYGARFLFAPMVMEGSSRGNYTLFVIVPGEEMARKCADAAEAVVGNLNTPNTGVLFAWELSLVRGVPEEISRPEQDE